MAKKYIDIVNGQLTQNEATDVSTGVSEAGDIVALGSDGKLDESLLPTGIAADVKILPSSENMSATNLVNVWNDSGTIKARKADADNGRPAHGFIKDPVTAPADVNVYFEGTIPGLTGLTGGDTMFLGTTAGESTDTAPTGSGNIVQPIGTAISDTEISFEPGQTVILA
jgi:hypothetical protein